MNKTFNREAFKEKLEAQTSFPTLYMFKFIVPNGRESEISAIFPNNNISLKSSSKGNYVSATIQAMMPSSDAIMEMYDKAAEIEGLISL